MPYDSSADPVLILDRLRAEIDAVDDALLSLIERRQALAGAMAEAGCKGSAEGLRLRPDREHAVVSRLSAAASAQAAPLVEPLWREIMSAGLAAQQRLEVRWWSGGRRGVEAAARARFGAQVRLREAASPTDALDAAETGEAVAVLGLGEAPWWSDLAESRPALWVFETLGGRAAPSALAVGRLAPESLAPGAALRVCPGGDAQPEAAPRRVVAGGAGPRLYAERRGGLTAEDRALGLIGRVPA